MDECNPGERFRNISLCLLKKNTFLVQHLSEIFYNANGQQNTVETNWKQLMFNFDYKEKAGKYI